MCRFVFVLLLLLCISCGSPEIVNKSEPALLSLEKSDNTYLPDFSYAGYGHGEKESLATGTELSVSDYGAIANDGIDDTDAFIAAITAANETPGPVVIMVPSGKFILSDYLYLQRDSLTLKGVGSRETVLFINKSLSELPLPNQMSELQEYLVSNNKRVKPSMKLFSAFSWTGGFIWVRKPQSRGLAYLTTYDSKSNTKAVSIQEATRGENTLRISPDEISQLQSCEGQLVRVDWFNKQGKDSELLRHIYLDSVKIGKRHWINGHRPLITQYATLRSINAGLLTLKEPLLHDVREGWTATISRADLLNEVGIEGLMIEFPNTEYAGHHLESGYNAIYMTDAAHSRIRDVKILNADNAVLSDNAAFVTLEQLVIDGRLGHYAVHLGKTNHILVKNLRVDAEEIHSISFNTGCKAGVFTDVMVSKRPTLDQHCGLNHQNLFDRITLKNIPAEHDIFKHGGAGYWRPTHGAYNTFWNVSLEYESASMPKAGDSITVGGISDGPHARFVGLKANIPVKLDYGPSVYQEKTNDEMLAVPSLYEYQLNNRLNK